MIGLVLMIIWCCVDMNRCPLSNYNLALHSGAEMWLKPGKVCRFEKQIWSEVILDDLLRNRITFLVLFQPPRIA